MVDKTNSAVAPVIKDDRTLVPLRFIAESFGAEVGWDETTKTVMETKDGNIIKLVIGGDIINRNGKDIKTDIPAQVFNDRTFIPLRALVENLDKKVFWYKTGLIVISDVDSSH